MTRRERTVCLAATLAVASAVFTGTIRLLPRLIEARALARFGAANTMHFARRPDASSRGVVRPSPDMLYAACPFDLANGPLRLTAKVPHSTYWSVSAYDAATDNFFVRDDRQLAGDSIEIIAIRRGMALPPLGNTPERVILFAPTERGLFLIRLLINDETQLAALDAIRHQAACETVVSPPGSG
jgi:uncharacterized membrane protein